MPLQNTGDGTPSAKNGSAANPGQFARYVLAMGLVLMALLLYHGIARLMGSDLAPFITFFPTIMLVALLAGLGPGLVATAAAALSAAYFILPPYGFVIASFRDAASLALFVGMGVFMSVVGELYCRARNRLEETVAARTAELSRANEQLTRKIEEHKQTEKSLRDERDFNTAVLDTAGALVVVIDREGRITRFNRACEQVTGYAEAEVLGRVGFEFLIPPDELTGVRKTWDALCAGDIPIRHENHWLAKDGSRRLIAWANTAIVGPQGRIDYIIGTGVDITDRKDAEEALRESEACLNRAQAIAHLGSWVLDLATNRLSWSDEVYRIFGLRPQEFGASYDAFLGAVHPDDRAAVDAAYSGSLREGRDTYEIEHRIVRKSDGEIRNVHEKCEHFRDAAGRIVRSIGMVHDITDRKEAEDALKESEARFSTVFDSSPVGIGISRLGDGKFVDVNEAFLAIYGYTREEVIGHSALELGMWDHVARESLVSELEKQGRVQNVEMKFRKKSGKTGDQLVSVELIELGDEMCILGLLTDITDRKRHEEELIRARRAAESANLAKSQFLANMSHELRTPMTGILGMLELTLDEELAPRQRQYLETVQASAEALLRLLNDILDFSRIEAGAIAFAEEPFNLEWCVRSALELLAIEAQRKGLDLAVEIAPDTPGLLKGDEGRIRQVLVNLIGNAVKFTEQGKVVVRIAGGEKAAEGRREITFAVTDTGIGIPADKKELLFQSFSQVDASTTRRHGGTGLGLAISKGVVERMGGRISFTSTEGVGSAFSFTLPLREAGMTGTPPPGGSPAPGPTDMAHGRRLLLVEDDPNNRALIETILRNRGFGVDVAADGQEAVAQLEKERGEYALILMDVQMPRMDGYEATRIIREREKPRGMHTPIVALTAHAFPEDRERCLAAGMDAYLAKPIDFAVFHRLLEELTRKRA